VCVCVCVCDVVRSLRCTIIIVYRPLTALQYGACYVVNDDLGRQFN